MATYANDVLVETDWLADHAKDPKVRVFEVDVDTNAYEQGHVAGAIGLNWRTDLQPAPTDNQRQEHDAGGQDRDAELVRDGEKGQTEMSLGT